jgi:hypothetical protein
MRHLVSETDCTAGDLTLRGQPHTTSRLNPLLKMIFDKLQSGLYRSERLDENDYQ